MFLRSVEQVSALPLSHVSVYALELAKENSPLARQVAAYGYSDDDLADMYDACVQMLEKRNFCGTKFPILQRGEGSAATTCAIGRKGGIAHSERRLRGLWAT